MVPSKNAWRQIQIIFPWSMSHVLNNSSNTLWRFNLNKSISSDREMVWVNDSKIQLTDLLTWTENEKKRPVTFSIWRFPICTFYFLQKGKPFLKEESHSQRKAKECAVGCRPIQGRAEDTPRSKIVLGSGRRWKVPYSSTPFTFPLPAGQRLSKAEKAPGLRTQLNVTASARQTSDVTGRGPHEGCRCWPAVTRRAYSQSSLGAGAGRPLNSARQLPAVWRVHSAMQYVCQRCGTKEQPFCD